MMVDAIRRDRESGVTLIEMLVVLLLIGVAAGSVGLALGGGDRKGVVEREFRLLANRLELAAERALVTGTPALFEWDSRGYGFLEADGASWSAHGLAALRNRHDLPPDLELSGDDRTGRRILAAHMLPATGALVLELRSGTSQQSLTFDGMTLRKAAR